MKRQSDKNKPLAGRDAGRTRQMAQGHKKSDVIQYDGRIVEALGFENFRVNLDNGVIILASVSGRMRQNHIRLLPGDRVQVEMSPYDLSRGRISYRYKV